MVELKTLWFRHEATAPKSNSCAEGPMIGLSPLQICSRWLPNLRNSRHKFAGPRKRDSENWWIVNNWAAHWPVVSWLNYVYFPHAPPTNSLVAPSLFSRCYIHTSLCTENDNLVIILFYCIQYIDMMAYKSQ